MTMKTPLLYLSITFCLCFFSLFSQDSSPNRDTNLPPRAPHSDSEYAFPLEEILPPKTQDKDWFYKEFISVMTTLGLILTVGLILAWLLKKTMNKRIQQINTTSLIKILESRQLSQKTGIYLVEIYGTILAVAESQNGATVLTQWNEETPEPSSSPSSFAKILEEKERDRS